MPQPDLTSQILSVLWLEYRNDPGGSYDIVPLCGSEAAQVSSNLRAEGLVKDDIVSEDGKVLCAISMKGATRIDAGFVEGKMLEVLRGMGEVNSISNVMSLLKLEAKDFQFAFDLANEMQNRDYVKLLYAFQPGKVVSVEMTLAGVRRRGAV